MSRSNSKYRSLTRLDNNRRRGFVMIQTYVNEGLVMILKRIVDPSVVYHLFNNDVPITKATLLAELAEESSFGYAPSLILLSAWTLNAVVADVGVIIATPVTFTPVGGDWSLYGYYVTDLAATKLLWAATFDAAPIIVLDGQTVIVTPKIGDFSNSLS